MSPHDMTPYREQFDAACSRLGWRRIKVKQQHERDWNCSWKEDVWVNAQEQRLFAESNLTEAMVKELIALAGK